MRRQFELQIRHVRRQEVAAARELLACYAALAARSAHLLDGLLQGRPPVQWAHYPADDAVDRRSGYQYFYHCHEPGGRAGGIEHGHFHLFARLTADRPSKRRPAHLLAVAVTPKGVPHELFTVNQWVTGGRVLSAADALCAVDGFRVRSAGDPLVNRWLAALLRLFRPQIEELLELRDRRLRAAARRRRRVPLVRDRRVEVLSVLPIDIDERLRGFSIA